MVPLPDCRVCKSLRRKTWPVTWKIVDEIRMVIKAAQSCTKQDCSCHPFMRHLVEKHPAECAYALLESSSSIS